MFKKFGYLLGLILLAIMLGAAGCQKQVKNATPPAGTSSGEEGAAPSAQMPAPDATSTLEAIVNEESATTTDELQGDGSEPEEVVVNVSGKKFSFTPAEIRVKQGQKVKINFTNAEGFHNLVIDEFNVSTPQINAGASASIEFTANKTGTFSYYCSVANHRQLGMEGKLIVE
ncbi:MAG: plastocyanin/azurin family copper-binding protein [Patescibacteria group bacterium]